MGGLADLQSQHSDHIRSPPAVQTTFLNEISPEHRNPGPEKHPKPKMLNSQSPEPPYPPAHFVKLEAHPILYPSGLWRLGVVEPSMANRPRGHALGERKAQGRMAFQVEVGDLRVRPTGVFHAHRHCIEALSGERNSS